MITKFKLFENEKLPVIYLSYDFEGSRYESDRIDFIDFIKDKNPNIIDSEGEPLIFNVYHNEHLNREERYKIFKLMIDNGLDVDVSIEDGNTILIEIANEDEDDVDFDLLYLLIDAGADWNLMPLGYTFIDALYDDEQEVIINKYPEKYQKYIREKQARKFNI